MSSIDLYSLANSGINASSKLLQTTSNNIANVNTEGYVRERTDLSYTKAFGVEIGDTDRIIDVFAQNQLRRDITKVGELTAFSDKTSAIDNLLASESNSLSKGLTEYFSALQTAADDPTNLASREQVLGKAESLYQRFTTLSDYMVAKEDELNAELTSGVNKVNSLIQTIGELNSAIVVAQGNNSNGIPTDLLDERDKVINELSSMLEINIRESTSQSGALSVNLLSGESLVLDNGSFNLFEVNSVADTSIKELRLQTDFQSSTKGDVSIPIDEDSLGGSMGGLFRFRNEVLGPTMRDIGQLAVSFADAMNTQNKLGMDLDGQLGTNLFDIPSFEGLSYEGTTGDFLVTGRLIDGEGASLTDADYKIEVTSVAAGIPDEIEVTLLNADGTAKKDGAGNPLVYSNVAISSGYNALPGGIEVNFDGATAYSVGDEFLLQPTKLAASSIELLTNRPEDLAFAAPVRAQADATNLGSANVSSVTVTNTAIGGGNEQSAFDGAGGLHDSASAPGGTVGAPTQIVFTADDTYQVLDGESPQNVITTVSGVTNLNNLLAQASSTAGWPVSFSAQDDYPGYDISLDGVPKAGDSFSISFNTNGFNDNSNALSLAGLQTENLVQLSSESSNAPRTFQDSYASLVGRIGEEASMADISLQSAEAMKLQSENWFDSVSGVSLDEEASNLIRYQQSYAAAARILTTAQELFDTILQSAR